MAFGLHPPLNVDATVRRNTALGIAAAAAFSVFLFFMFLTTGSNQLPFEVFRVASRVSSQQILTLRRYEWSTLAEYSFSGALVANDPDHDYSKNMGRPRWVVLVDLSRSSTRPTKRNTAFRVSCSYGDGSEMISGGEEGNTGILGKENPIGGVHFHDVLPPFSYPSEDMHCKLEYKMLPTSDDDFQAPMLTFPDEEVSDFAKQQRRLSVLRIPEGYIRTGAWARPIAIMGRTDGWETLDKDTRLPDIECRPGSALIVQAHISRVRGTKASASGMQRLPFRMKYADAWTGSFMFADSAVANGDGGEMSMHGVIDCQGGQMGELILQVGPGPDVMLPDDITGGQQTRRITSLVVPITGLAHQTWRLHDVQTGSSTEWAPMPTEMRVGVALDEHQAVTVWADISLVQCESSVEFRIIINAEEIGYMPFRCAKLDNAMLGEGSISFHGVSGKMPAGVHAIEVEYRVDSGDVVFPVGMIADMHMQERRLTVLAVEAWPLADVQGSDDLALLRTADASSISDGMVAAAAVDGNVFGDYPSSELACTVKEGSPWLQIDLGGSRMVGMVDIYGASHGGQNMECASCTESDPLGEIWVTLLDEQNQQVSSQFVEPYQQLEQGQHEKKKSIVYDPYIRARYVKIHKQSKMNEMLCIAEVLVFESV